MGMGQWSMMRLPSLFPISCNFYYQWVVGDSLKVDSVVCKTTAPSILSANKRLILLQQEPLLLINTIILVLCAWGHPRQFSFLLLQLLGTSWNFDALSSSLCLKSKGKGNPISMKQLVMNRSSTFCAKQCFLLIKEKPGPNPGFWLGKRSKHPNQKSYSNFPFDKNDLKVHDFEEETRSRVKGPCGTSAATTGFRTGAFVSLGVSRHNVPVLCAGLHKVGCFWVNTDWGFLVVSFILEAVQQWL